jgi:hypothetical protein
LGVRVLLVLDDSPTKRYGPKVEGAGVHHNHPFQAVIAGVSRVSAR